MSGSMLKCSDDRDDRVVSAQARYTTGGRRSSSGTEADLGRLHEVRERGFRQSLARDQNRQAFCSQEGLSETSVDLYNEAMRSHPLG